MKTWIELAEEETKSNGLMWTAPATHRTSSDEASYGWVKNDRYLTVLINDDWTGEIIRAKDHRIVDAVDVHFVDWSSWIAAWKWFIAGV